MRGLQRLAPPDACKRHVYFPEHSFKFPSKLNVLTSNVNGKVTDILLLIWQQNAGVLLFLRPMNCRTTQIEHWPGGSSRHCTAGSLKSEALWDWKSVQLCTLLSLQQ
jgi:hypothetical protein